MNVREKIVYYLSSRDHSLKELKQKLSKKKYSPEEILEGLAWAESKQLLSTPEHVAELMSRGLHRKKKGILYMNQYLKAKGLPAVPLDEALELEKARALCAKRFSTPPYTFAQKQDIYAYLSRRGYIDTTIQQVCKDTSK